MANKHLLPDQLSPEQAEFIAQTFAALGDPTRARIIFALTQREMTVTNLAEMAGVTPSAISHHLARLRGLRIVRPNREGNQVFYSIDDRHITNLYVEALNHLDHVWRLSKATSANMEQEA
jgi:DNA-binding transcriptional ArsR family regulator